MALVTRHLTGFGLRVAVRGPAAAVAQVACLGLRTAPKPGRADRSFEVDHASVAAVNDDLLWFVAEHARTRVFIHAGVVGVDGAAVVIPGRSLSGKSTLVAALVRAGATYYSDEFGLLDRRGRVHPYTRPLAFRPPGRARSVAVPHAELGGAVGDRALPVRAVVVTTYKPGSTWRARSQPGGRGALALVDNAVAARSHSARVLGAVASAVTDADIYAGPRGEADETAARILRRLGTTSR